MQGTAIQQSKAADVWACGVALYTMLTHADPFDPAMLAAKGPRVPPSTAQGGSFVWPEGCVPSQSCQDLVEQMLQPDTNARITTEGIMQHPWFLADLPRELMVRFPTCCRHLWTFAILTLLRTMPASRVPMLFIWMATETT